MLANLVLACVSFLLAHRLVSGLRVRDALVRRLGERRFLKAFSALSVSLTAWLVTAYASVAPEQVDAVHRWVVAPSWVFIAIACYLIMAGLTTRNPTIAGLGESVRAPAPVQGVIRLTRHPFLVGVVVLCAAHLLLRPTLPDLMFFGTLGLVALVGMPSIDAKRRRAFGPAWTAFEQATSVVPGVAVLAGRQSIRLRDIGFLRPALGVLLLATLVALHRS